MNRSSRTRNSTACLFVAALVVTTGNVSADTTPKALGAELPQSADSTSTISDLVLGTDGRLVGRVVGAQHTPQIRIPVTVHFGRQVIARTFTDAQGAFAVVNLRGGIHQLTAGRTTRTVRLWSATTAPPSASESIILTTDGTIVRGQSCGCGESGCGECAGGGGGGGGPTWGHALGGAGLVGVGVIGGVIGFNHGLDRDRNRRSP